jgi:hypothetical protein
MAFSVPHSFTGNTVLQADDVRENYQAVRTRYHNLGSNMLATTAFVKVQHIQPPRSSPIEGILLNGVSGVLGGQAAGAPFARPSFSSDEMGDFHHLTNTSFSFVPRNAMNLLFHWWAEVIVGPDASPYTLTDPRYLWVSPYRGGPASVFAANHAQECPNNYDGFSPSGVPKGAEQPYERIGASFLSGTYPIRNAPAGQELRVGLSAFSGVGRAVIVNYGVVLEAYNI